MSKLFKIISVVALLCVALVVAAVAILKSLDFNEYKDIVAEKVSEATGRELKISGDLALEISLNPSIAVEGVTFSNAAWAGSKEMITVEKFEAEVSLLPLLSGTVDVKRVVLEGVTVLAETDKAGKGNWVFDSLTGQKETKDDDAGSGSAVIPIVRMVRIKDVKVSYHDGVSGETIDLIVEDISVQADGSDAPLTLDIKGQINKQSFSVAGNIGTINALLSGGMVPLNLDVATLATTLNVAGQVGVAGGNPAADLKVNVSVPNLSDTVAAVASFAPAVKDIVLPPVNTLSVVTVVKFSDNKLALSDLTLKAGSTDLNGKLSIDLEKSVPLINAVLNSKLINLDELLPKSENKTDTTSAASTESSTNGDGRLFPADPLPLDGLKLANVKLNFKGQKITGQGLDISDPAVDLTLQDGKLQIKPAATVFSGEITGDVVVDGSSKTPVLKTRLTIAQLDYGQALDSQDLKDIASGKVDVDIDVSGKGGSVRALMAGLNGKVRIVTENGRLESNALNIVSTDLLNILDSKDDKTLRCGVVHFDVKSGMANVRAIVVETGGLSVIGTGSVNLKTEQPKLRIEPRSKKANLATAALVPVEIHGTLAKPDWTIDAAAAAGNIVSGAARTGTAIATMGLSLLIEKAVSSGTGMGVDENDYCVPALAGKAVVPGEIKSAEASPKPDFAASEPPAIDKKTDDPLSSIGEGIGSGLKSLFGTSNN